MRRYFLSVYDAEGNFKLFSAHAEVFPTYSRSSPYSGSLLRACGGISRTTKHSARMGGSSPRMRRYFRGSVVASREEVLVSAHAEVFPSIGGGLPARHALLRACGGISYDQAHTSHTIDSSPRMRRYFLVGHIV